MWLTKYSKLFLQAKHPNKNTLFGIHDSTEVGQHLLSRANQNGKSFCLTNDGGPFPALAFQKPCITNATSQMWTMGNAPLITWEKSGYCWDTLGATQNHARITLSPCNATSESQQWVILRWIIEQEMKLPTKVHPWRFYVVDLFVCWACNCSSRSLRICALCCLIFL